MFLQPRHLTLLHPVADTGLDEDVSGIALLTSDYSVYTMRQASRRSWRIGQTQPVRVVFMSYRGTLQADALKLVARKLQSSLAVEGELTEDGLAAFGDDGDDVMMALARKIVSGEHDEAESVEEVFATAQDAASEAEELLVDSDWGPVDTDAVEVNGNGHRDFIGPTVELAPVNGHNSNGHYDEADEPQRALFSWAEFMAAEPARPKSRRREHQP